MRSWLSSTTRSGWRSLSSMRTFKAGSSARMVPTPVRIAELRARKVCASVRACFDVIQRLSPDASAVCPSRLVASLTRTKGMPVRMRRT